MILGSKKKNNKYVKKHNKSNIINKSKTMKDPVVEYLEANKDDYPQEDLVSELKKAGYSALEIQAGIEAVSSGADTNDSSVSGAPQSDMTSESRSDFITTENVEEEIIDENRPSTIDYIIKKWFPVIGVLFVVGGLSYLFYDGLWKNINEIGRLAIGFIFGILFITGGYTFENKLRGFGDVIIGGGVLIMYITLIFGSRFQSAEIAIIPEVFALVIALAFSIAIAFYAYSRKSKYILIMGALGGYLTPFFVGRAGEFRNYLESEVTFQYELGLPVFLIYFLAIGLAVFIVSNKMFLKGVGLLNSVGLFLGTFSLVTFMGGEFSENTILLAAFSMVVILLHIAAMVINAKKFKSETDPFLIGGYALPFIWFVIMVRSFLDDNLSNTVNAGLFATVAATYFAGWHYLRNITNSDKHFTLYIGGLASIVMGMTYIIPSLGEYQGLFLSVVSLIFIALYIIKESVSREVSMLMFAAGGVLFNLNIADEISFGGMGELSGISVFIILTLIPFILMTPAFGLMKKESEFWTIRKISGYFASMVVVLILVVDIFDWEKIPMEFLFLTVPALVLVVMGLIEKKAISRQKFFDISVGIVSLGFVWTLAIMLSKLSIASEQNNFLATRESLIGVTTLMVMFLAVYGYKKLVEDGVMKRVPFIVTFILYLVLWAVVTHEIIGILNSLGLDFSNQAIEGIRAFTVTIWWAGLALWMMFSAELSSGLRDQKNIGFSLLAMTILKLIFYDLANVNTNLKVFLFIIIGAAITAVSYYANKKGTDNDGK
jgi:hypothetical protein